MSHSVLSRCPLFAGIAAADIPVLLECLGARVVSVEKQQTIFWEGDPAQDMGIVLEGAVQVVRDDYYGNRTIVAQVEPGGLFAEAFACAGSAVMPVSAYALKDSRVMLFSCQKMLTVCSSACDFHNKLVKNLLTVVAQRNLNLSSKIQVMSRKTTREKLLAYLSEQAKKAGSEEFTVPFDRQALADYLGVERSAMSAELSKLRRDGILDTKGAWFHLYS